MKAKLFLLIVFCFCLTAPVQAQQGKVAGIYSNLRYDKGDGELLGMELFIFPTQTGYSVLVQIAASPRYQALLPLTADKNNVEFTLPADGPYGAVRFVGAVDRDVLIGQFTEGPLAAAGERERRFKRGNSYWQ